MSCRQWVNTVLGNLKTATNGTYHAFDFHKYASRYLAEAQYRFNRRFDLSTIMTRLLFAASHTGKRIEPWLRLAEMSANSVSFSAGYVFRSPVAVWRRSFHRRVCIGANKTNGVRLAFRPSRPWCSLANRQCQPFYQGWVVENPSGTHSLCGLPERRTIGVRL
jgi:hypothetical protein